MTGCMLISGGSRGIGRATALAAGRAGWPVALTYRTDADMAQRTVSEITQAGGDAIAIQADTTVEADVLRCFDSATQRFGAIRSVVVNAGAVAPSLPLADLGLDRMRQVIEVNLIGALLFAREAARRLPEWADAQDCSITFVSSVAAKHGSPFEYIDYAAAKGGVDTMTVGLAKELAAQRIRVNAVRPGVIDTDIHASGGQPDRAGRVGQTVPLGRAGQAQEIASAILWLASDQATYTTGALLDVTGGR